MYEHKLYLDGVDPEDRDHVEHMLSKLDKHCQIGGGLGDFLRALIVGDLHGACAHADGTNIKYLRMYSKYCYNQLPGHRSNLARPVLRALDEVMCKYCWMDRDQIAKAAGMFRVALRTEQTAAIVAAQAEETETLREEVKLTSAYVDHAQEATEALDEQESTEEQ